MALFATLHYLWVTIAMTFQFYCNSFLSVCMCICMPSVYMCVYMLCVLYVVCMCMFYSACVVVRRQLARTDSLLPLHKSCEKNSDCLAFHLVHLSSKSLCLFLLIFFYFYFNIQWFKIYLKLKYNFIIFPYFYFP